jgi:hypothetical protein
MAKEPAGKKPAPPKITTPQPAASSTPAGKGAPAPSVDWERIELDYRAAIKTLRQIAEEHGITHGAINKRAKRDGWERDLSEKINAKADALVSKAAVSTPVSMETRIAEKQVIDANAQAVAEVRLAHRHDIHRGRRIANALFAELEKQTDADTVVLLSELGEMLRNPDDNGQDKLNDLYQKVISLPERARTAKTLAETLRIVVDMERTAFGMDAKEPDKPAPGTPGHVPPAVAVYHVAPPPRAPEDDEA